MPDEFSEVTDITVNRRNSTSINPTTQSVSTEQANAQNQLNNQFWGLNSNDLLPECIAIYTTAIAIPDEFSYATDTMANRRNSISTSPRHNRRVQSKRMHELAQRNDSEAWTPMEELDLNKANDAIGEYKASEYQDWLDLEPEPTRQMLGGTPGPAIGT